MLAKKGLVLLMGSTVVELMIEHINNSVLKALIFIHL